MECESALWQALVASCDAEPRSRRFAITQKAIGLSCLSVPMREISRDAPFQSPRIARDRDEIQAALAPGIAASNERV